MSLLTQLPPQPQLVYTCEFTNILTLCHSVCLGGSGISQFSCWLNYDVCGLWAQHHWPLQLLRIGSGVLLVHWPSCHLFCNFLPTLCLSRRMLVLLLPLLWSMFVMVFSSLHNCVNFSFLWGRCLEFHGLLETCSMWWTTSLNWSSACWCFVWIAAMCLWKVMIMFVLAFLRDIVGQVSGYLPSSSLSVLKTKTFQSGAHPSGHWIYYESHRWLSFWFKYFWLSIWWIVTACRKQLAGSADALLSVYQQAMSGKGTYKLSADDELQLLEGLRYGSWPPAVSMFYKYWGGLPCLSVYESISSGSSTVGLCSHLIKVSCFQWVHLVLFLDGVQYDGERITFGANVVSSRSSLHTSRHSSAG